MTRAELLHLLSGYDVRDTQPVEVPPRVLAEAAALLAADARLGAAEHKAAALGALEAWLRGPKNEERTVELSLPYDGRISVIIRRFLLPGCDLSQHDVGYGNDLATAIASALKNKT